MYLRGDRRGRLSSTFRGGGPRPAVRPSYMIRPCMTLTAEDRKTDLVNRLVAEARNRLGADKAESVEDFVRRYFALVAPDDIIYSTFDTLLGGALSLWEFGQQRKPGAPKIRLFNPTVEANGWALEHTVIEIVNDDMPFLVDSVTAELNRRERNIHLLLHPMANVRRDDAGNRLELADTQAAPIDAVRESYMHIEISEETEPTELEALRAALEEVLGQVRVAVHDWATMRQKLVEDTAELDAHALPMPAEEVDEARQFLKWLDDGNFILLGYRRYGFETHDGKDFLSPQPGIGRGILREIRSESRDRGVAPLSADDSAY